MSAIPTKQLELWLAGWTKSHNGGTKVTFTINDDDLPYFENATIRKGKHAGQRYAAVLVQLQDDDTPDPESIKPLAGVAKAHELAEAGAAGAAVHTQKPTESVESGVREHRNKFPAGYCGLAVRWCDDVHFRDWLAVTFPEVWKWTALQVNILHKTAGSERAAALIKRVCHVQSRTELDTIPDAHALFRDRIFTPYKKQRDEDGVDE